MCVRFSFCGGRGSEPAGEKVILRAGKKLREGELKEKGKTWEKKMSKGKAKKLGPARREKRGKRGGRGGGNTDGDNHRKLNTLRSRKLRVI